MTSFDLITYSQQPGQHEPTQPIRVNWLTTNGTVPVTIIAYSLGATMAYCIIGLGDVLESGNFALVWLPVSVLRFP